MKSFQDKVVVVTGASRGIGQAVCAAFAREGAIVAGVARGDLQATAKAVSEQGGRFEPIQADLGSGTSQECMNLVRQVVSRAGRLDVLVNNAGIIRRAPAVDFSEADWNAVLAINLSTPFFLCQAAARWWLNEGRNGSSQNARLKIINIASLLSFQGGITVPAYAASKHGILGITKALANEWAAQRMNINAIAPGYITTENTQALREDPIRNRAILDRIPEGRWGQPGDIADACVFLASSGADYLNGSVLNIDGGWLGR